LTDAADEQAEQARTEGKRNRIVAWSWSAVLIPPGVIGYFTLDLATFTAITVLATWILSCLTMTISQLSIAKAAEAKAAGYENP
jgi:hypothetical protein